MKSSAVPDHHNAAHSAHPGFEASSLSLREVSKVFDSPDGGTVLAVDRVSLSIAAGEFVSLIGQSGCGKSTILRMIAGLDFPTTGEVRVGSDIIRKPSADRGLMFQSHNLFPWLTIRRNIQAGLVARGLLQERGHEVDELMELVGLEKFGDVYPHQLSGGMSQRAALARALINHPKVLLLDEPLGALDQLTRMQLQDEILNLWQARGTTMVLVTHYIDEAIYMSDRVVVMTPRPGRIERVIDVPLPRPRHRNSPEFQELREEILNTLHVIEGGGNASTSLPNSNPHVATTPSGNEAPNSLDADVIVIGGGPAGSTVGAYLAQAGIDNLILDKVAHPRPHVGESLVCSTVRLFDEIGFLPEMEKAGFVRKYGANWTHWANAEQRSVRFREIPGLEMPQDYTYHVDRARFDHLLLGHAGKLGSRVLQNAAAERVEFDAAGRAIGVRVQHEGASRLLRCRLVVDASGRSAILGNQLKLKEKDAQFNQFAVHGWFEGMNRGAPETADYIHVHLLPVRRGWAWQIPISSTVTSVGVVTDGDSFVKSGESTDEFFARHLAMNPSLTGRMAGSKRLHDLHKEGNYSYVMKRFAGDGWVMVGDAARFIDPIFSSGVSVAMESAKRAAAAIVAALRNGDAGATAFADYEATVRGGIDVWREFILLFYKLPPLFFNLLQEPDARLPALRLLQGEVYDRGSAPVLERMRREIQIVADASAHPLKPFLNAAERAS